MMVFMFAPYCSRCETRVLLGPSRIVHSRWHAGGRTLLRCRCGTIVDALACESATSPIDLGRAG